MHDFEHGPHPQAFQCQIARVSLRSTTAMRDAVLLCKSDEVREGAHRDGGMNDEHLREARNNRDRCEVALRIEWQFRIERWMRGQGRIEHHEEGMPVRRCL